MRPLTAAYSSSKQVGHYSTADSLSIRQPPTRQERNYVVRGAMRFHPCYLPLLDVRELVNRK